MITPEENKIQPTHETLSTKKSTETNGQDVHDDHMQVDEEGNEISPDDQV